jgi:hypothetical protein
VHVVQKEIQAALLAEQFAVQRADIGWLLLPVRVRVRVQQVVRHCLHHQHEQAHHSNGREDWPP